MPRRDAIIGSPTRVTCHSISWRQLRDVTAGREGILRSRGQDRRQGCWASNAVVCNGRCATAAMWDEGGEARSVRDGAGRGIERGGACRLIAKIRRDSGWDTVCTQGLRFRARFLSRCCVWPACWHSLILSPRGQNPGSCVTRSRHEILLV
jgi:hypothetical protein